MAAIVSQRDRTPKATPAALYTTMPKAVPGEVTDPQTHDRIRHDTGRPRVAATSRQHSYIAPIRGALGHSCNLIMR